VSVPAPCLLVRGGGGLELPRGEQPVALIWRVGGKRGRRAEENGKVSKRRGVGFGWCWRELLYTTTLASLAAVYGIQDKLLALGKHVAMCGHVKADNRSGGGGEWDGE